MENGRLFTIAMPNGGLRERNDYLSEGKDTMVRVNTLAKYGCSVITGLCILWLSGCSKPSTLAETCQASPEICHDLDLDATCREKREPLLALRLSIKQNPALAQQDETQFQRLQLVESYNRCLQRAAGIQHVNHPQLTSNSQRAYALTSLTLAQIQQQTKGSHNPHLAYYHWVHFDDSQALATLLQAQRNGQIKEAYILAGLAMSQLKTEPDFARRLYLEALRDATPSDFVADWLLALAQVTPDREIKYLLQKTNIDLTQRKADQRMMRAELGASAEIQQQLDQQSLVLAKALSEGSYASSHWPDFLAGDKQAWLSIIKAEG